MKKIFIITFLVCLSAMTFAQQQIDSNGQLRPLGNYPVTSARFIKGAARSVNTLEDRDNIPAYLRDTGMVVYINTLDSAYILKNGTDNSNWKSYKLGAGGIKGNSKTILDTIQTTGESLTIAAFSGGGRVVSLSTVGRNGSNFLSTYVTANDTTYIDYNYAPNGQVVYKLTVLDASDTVSGGGREVTGGIGTGPDTLYVLDTAGRNTTIYRDTTIINSTGNDTTIVQPVTSSSITSALGGTPLLTPLDYSSTNVVNKPALKTVATSGLYGDLTGRPTLSTVASSGSYPDLINKPALKTVATSGLYSDLTGLPALKTVATSGLYSDLTGLPALKTVATSGLYSDLTGRPTLSTVASSGLYADLSGKPTLSTVASTGAYTDLTGKPTIPAQLNLVASQGVTITGTYPNLTAKVDTTYLNTYLSSHAIISTSGSCFVNNTRFGLLSQRDAGETLQQYQLTQQTADSLGFPIIRQGMSSTTGYSNVMALINSNRQVQINLRNTPEDGTRNFTSNTERAAYVQFLDTLFRNSLAPAQGDTLIAACNEDGNKGYHILDTSTNLANQSAYRYFNNELKPMDSIAHLYGSHFKVTTGGSTGEVGWYFVWKNLMDSGRTANANELQQAVFPPGTNLNNFPTSSSYALPIRYTQQLLPYIRTSTITYWNWHVKVITNGVDSAHINPNIVAWGVEAWRNLTGKDVVTNEAATTSINPNNSAELMVQLSKVMPYVFMYDGVSRASNPTWAGDDVSYRNLGNSINAIGVTLRNTLQALKR